MIEIALAEDDARLIRQHLLGGAEERCAVLFCNVAKNARRVRVLVHDIQFPEEADYTRKGKFEAELSPLLVARVTKRARVHKETLIFAHSHPGDHPPQFSPIDDKGETILAQFLSHRVPASPHCALVVSAGGLRARSLGSKAEARVVSVGKTRDVLFDPLESREKIDETFDRQVRAFGPEGQRQIQKLRIGIVGLGGTGSIVSQQLTHLGVRDFLLVDPDRIETTNLNRIANATHSDLDANKVCVAARYIRSVAPHAHIEEIVADVVRDGVARRLLDTDFIFGCTDSHGSRAVLQHICYQYLIPYIDMGVSIVTRHSAVEYIVGRSQLLAPGLACFACANLLDAGEVRRDMMTERERTEDPYLQGEFRTPAPAVMSLNGTIASLSMSMFLSITTQMPIPARHLIYDGKRSVLRSIEGKPDESCYVCSRTGAFARGDSMPLLTRRDS
jgi:molybdopterin-synthase adenylyltransferase